MFTVCGMNLFVLQNSFINLYRHSTKLVSKEVLIVFSDSLKRLLTVASHSVMSVHTMKLITPAAF